MTQSKFRISKEIEFDAGHRVPLHDSKCRNPHGHRYRVVVNVVGDLETQGSETGMVMDFGRIKETLTTYVHDLCDHGFIVQMSDKILRVALESADNDWKIIIVPFPPTAEELARYFYGILSEKINVPYTESVKAYAVEVESVVVYETPTSAAVYPWRG